MAESHRHGRAPIGLPHWPARALVLAMLLLAAAGAPAREDGSDRIRVDAAGMEIKVYTYRPPGCAQPAVLLAFHGLKRKAKNMRNKARKLADAACLMVFAPLLDKQRFPNWRYHRAGVWRKGRVQPRHQWTANVLAALIGQARAISGNPRAPVYLFGHSAGGQFLSRSTAFSPPVGVTRIVVANPSVHVVPDPGERAPYGFGGVFPAHETEQRIRDYLAAPVSIYLGQEDTGSKYLVDNEAARRQGSTRIERGRWVFAMARRLARERGWEFAWRLEEAAGVGHSSRGMLEAPAMLRALGVSPAQSSRWQPVPGTYPAPGRASRAPLS